MDILSGHTQARPDTPGPGRPGRNVPGFGLRCLAALLLLAWPGARAHAAPEPKLLEYQAKAGILYKFADYVEWPAQAFASSNAPITIGILGDDPFGPFLDDLVKQVTVNHRSLVIRRSRELDDLKSCHLLYISLSEKGRLRSILDRLGRASVLTVSEIDGFASRGGMIHLYVKSKKPTYRINPGSARRAGLKVSSLLLTEDKVEADENPSNKEPR